jgi:hypothetical protein
MIVTTNGYTTENFTLKDIQEAIAKARAAMPPKSEQVTCYRMNGAMIEALKQRTEYMPTTLHPNTLQGTPVEQDDSVPTNAFISERADGTEVLHIDSQELRRPSWRADLKRLLRDPFGWHLEGCRTIE